MYYNSKSTFSGEANKIRNNEQYVALTYEKLEIRTAKKQLCLQLALTSVILNQNKTTDFKFSKVVLKLKIK